MTSKERLIGLLRYVEELARLTESTVFSVRSYRDLHFFEHELQNRVGIQHDIADPDGAVWLRIDRLQKCEPPKAEAGIALWLVISRDPTRPPQILDTRLESMSRENARALLEQGRVDAEDIMESPRAADVVDVRLRLDRFPDMQAGIDDYLAGAWHKWSDEEKPRRATIAIYDRFFKLAQAIESSGVENPTEVVCGVGVMLWKAETKTVEHPLIELLVEVDVDPTTHAVRVRPREAEPQIYTKPLVELGIAGAGRLAEAARKHFAQLDESEHLASGAEPVEISPFDSRAFEPVLRQAVSLVSSAVYFPSVASDTTDRSLPQFADDLIVTDTWAIYARPRSTNLFAQDIERLKTAVETAESLPPCVERIVSEPVDQEALPELDLRSGIGVPATEGSTGAIELRDEIPDVFFPKPFNDAQIEIVRRLERSDGVVVQGPPGTGKTHTIANIICHYLATGRSVLVVSKGEPALEVLRNHIPEGIRNLTISLLTSEREGLKQLEAAVTCMANEVTNQDTGRLDRDRRDREIEILQLRERIAKIDTRVSRIAELQLKPVAHLGIRPAELAKHIVADAQRHAWLPDRLGFDDKYNPQFSNEDIDATRIARRSVGADLVYLHGALPSPNDLPDSSSVCAIHRDLIQAAAVADRAKEANLPKMSLRVPEATSRADQLRTDVREVVEALKLVASESFGWLRPYYDAWRTEGGDCGRARPLAVLTDELRRLIVSRQRFLERPVQLPALDECHRDVLEAVRRAKRGERPFRLLSFGKRPAREALQKIRVGAEPPDCPSDWRFVADYLQFEASVATCIGRWNALAAELRLPSAPKITGDALAWMAQVLVAHDAVREAARRFHGRAASEIAILFPDGLDSAEIGCNEHAATSAIDAIESNLSTLRLSAARDGVHDVIDRLQSGSGPLVADMLRFLKEGVGNVTLKEEHVFDRWQDLMRELRRVLGLRPALETLARVAALVESSGAPQWAGRIRSEPVEDSADPWTPGAWQESWRFRRLEAYLTHIDRRQEVGRLSEERANCERRLEKAMAEVVRLRTYLGLKKRLGRARLSALQQFVTAIRNIGAGTGIRARRYRGDARRAMDKCVAAVPCWIMPTWRASESLPPNLGSFDLVIVDEASQSDAMALPALVRAEKLLVVGDDRQVSPSPIGIEERKLLQLRHSFLRDQPFGDLLMPGSSLYNLALAVFPGERVLLNEHFRCVEPIIRFSFQFYSERIQPVRIPKTSERLDPPLIDVYLHHGRRDGRKVNEAEALAIVDEIERLVKDSVYDGRSIGVVTLIGNKQAQVIQNLLLERIGEDAFLKHRIACGDSATFQGKERDIMFVSMVASPGQATAQTALLWEQRFNVALSRARDRMYLFRSVKAEDLRNPRDLKLKTINHFMNPMPVPVELAAELVDLCESDFERDVLKRLSRLGYRVTPQVTVGELRIDLVVEGENDRRLAIELDGDRHHGPERWFEDWNRQKLLERAGWTFWRCWASSFTLDPEGCMDELISRLKEMQIGPIGVQGGRHPYTEHRLIELDECPDAGQPNAEKSIDGAVAQGDKVILSFEDDPNRQYMLTITEKDTDLINGIVSVSGPPGDQLLGACEEDEVVLTWNNSDRRATILRIEKPQRERASRATDPASAASASTERDRFKPQHIANRPAMRNSAGSSDGKPSEDELERYRQYEEMMTQRGIRPRPLPDWIETFRKAQHQQTSE